MEVTLPAIVFSPIEVTKSSTRSVLLSLSFDGFWISALLVVHHVCIWVSFLNP